MSESGASVNHVQGIVIYDPILDQQRYATGSVLTNATPMDVKVVDDSGEQLLATTPTSYNVTLTVADTEYSQTLTTGTDKITVQARDNNNFRMAFETGKVATPTSPYITVKGGQNYWEDGLSLSGKTIYLASSTAGQVIEIIEWS